MAHTDSCSSDRAAAGSKDSAGKDSVDRGIAAAGKGAEDRAAAADIAVDRGPAGIDLRGTGSIGTLDSADIADSRATDLTEVDSVDNRSWPFLSC